jgi:hypothetical protein
LGSTGSAIKPPDCTTRLRERLCHGFDRSAPTSAQELPPSKNELKGFRFARTDIMNEGAAKARRKSGENGLRVGLRFGRLSRAESRLACAKAGWPEQLRHFSTRVYQEPDAGDAIAVSFP